jgi:hypothetical protein
VEFKPDIFSGLPGSSGWQDKTSFFKRVEVFDGQGNPLGVSSETGLRTVSLEGTQFGSTAFASSGIWRIRPIPGKIKCAVVLGNPDVRYSSSVVSGDLGTPGNASWYQFRVYFEAPGGGSSLLLDSGNGPQANDLSQWMITPYETNADGETDSQDFIDMAEQYTGN